MFILHFGNFLLKKGLPSHVYSFFHTGLKLGKNFAFSECVTSWIANASENKDLAESFKMSPDYLVVIISNEEDCAFYVFKKTDFVKERMAIIAK